MRWTKRGANNPLSSRILFYDKIDWAEFWESQKLSLVSFPAKLNYTTSSPKCLGTRPKDGCLFQIAGAMRGKYHLIVI